MLLQNTPRIHKNYFLLITAVLLTITLVVITQIGHHDIIISINQLINAGQPGGWFLFDSRQQGPKQPCPEMTCRDSNMSAEIFQARKQRLKDMCKLYASQSYTTLNWDDFDKVRTTAYYHPVRSWWNELVVSDKYRLLLCANLKVGNTNLKNYVIHVSSDPTAPIYNYTEDLEIVHAEQFNSPYLKRFKKYPTADAKQILADYTKAVFVREPHNRLISAWRDKFSTWEHDRFYSDFAVTIRRLIDPKKYARMPKDEVKKQPPLNFTEFLMYLKTLPDSRVLDHHWRPQHLVCDLCAIDYDYIGHFENFNCELQYIMKKVSRQENLPALPVPSDQYNEQIQILASVPEGLLKAVIEKHYLVDYELFGFNKPYKT